MAITKNKSAPLVVVCGATGVQGGSVVKALAESDIHYRLRGFTRDITKPRALELANQGVEMVGVSLTVDNQPNVLKAFEGANIAFVMTNFWEHMSKQREIDEGVMLVKISQAVGVNLLVWSGLDSVIESSGGKYTLADHFESKATVTEYAKQSGVPFVNVQAGFYASNYTGQLKPRKQADGSYVVALPASPDTIFPVIDMVNDYGLFVREAIESPAFGPGVGTEILSCGELISIADSIAQLAEITAKKISYVQISDEQFVTTFPGPHHIALEILESLHSHEEFGYYGGKDVKPSLQHLTRTPRTWAEYVQATDWEKVLG